MLVPDDASAAGADVIGQGHAFTVRTLLRTMSVLSRAIDGLVQSCSRQQSLSSTPSASATANGAVEEPVFAAVNKAVEATLLSVQAVVKTEPLPYWGAAPPTAATTAADGAAAGRVNAGADDTSAGGDAGAQTDGGAEGEEDEQDEQDVHVVAESGESWMTHSASFLAVCMWRWVLRRLRGAVPPFPDCVNMC